MKRKIFLIMLYRFLLILLMCPTVVSAQEEVTPQDKLKTVQQEFLKKQEEKGELLKVEAGNDMGAAESNIDIRTAPNDKEDRKYPDQLYIKVTLAGEAIGLHTILKTISKMTGYNLVLDSNIIDHQVNVAVKDIEVWRVLNTVLFPYSYSFRVSDNDLYILGSETRVFRLSLPPITQKFSDVTSNESFTVNGSNDSDSSVQNVKVGTQVYVENSIEELDFWSDIESSLKGLLSQTGKYSINKPAGMIVVSDLPGYLLRISDFLNEINEKVIQQIAVDVKVVEVSLTDEYKFGVDWNTIIKGLGDINNLSLVTNFATGNLTTGNVFTLSGTGPYSNSGTSEGGVNVVIKALDAQGDVEVVSQPKLVLLNNQIAVIQVGTTKAYIDEAKTETLSTGGTLTSLSTAQVQEGVTMRLLANTVGNDIYLSVAPVVTTIDEIRSVTSGSTTLEAPQTTTKSINTSVKVKNGETIAIGGLITSLKGVSEEKVPGLSKIPFLGKLFKYKEKKNNKTELIIFITPKRI